MKLIHVLIKVILFSFVLIGCGGSTTPSTTDSGNTDSGSTQNKASTADLQKFSKTSLAKIMPLGDSITYDDYYNDTRPASMCSGYRSHLWYLLENGEFSVDFVGSIIAGQGIEPPFDPNNEGHPGWKSSKIAGIVYDRLATYQPNMVLLHAGTNDLSTNPAGVTEILDQIQMYREDTNESVTALVALIIDREYHDPVITAFNNNLKPLLETRIDEGEDIVIVDMYNDANLTSDDYTDNTHPNYMGYIKMAQEWFKSINSVYNR